MTTPPSPRKSVVIVGGPTASGKSAFALDIAQALNSVVINADSMQLYAELSIITARPTEAEMAGVPHHLYGVLSAAQRGTAALWRTMALTEIAQAHAAGRLPVVVGGTGLYIRALTDGLADIPAIPQAVREAARLDYTAMGGAAFRERLIAVDPDSAPLHAADVTRLTRAWEVWAATGQTIGHWRTAAADGAPRDLRFTTFIIDPPRADLYRACDGRFRQMIAMGALAEVQRLAALNLDPELPAMKALGVPELIQHLNGVFTLDQAIEKASQVTRNYAKRQVTWFRHQTRAGTLARTPHACHTISLLHVPDRRGAIIRDAVTMLRETGTREHESDR